MLALFKSLGLTCSFFILGLLQCVHAESALLAKVRAGEDVKVVLLGTSLTAAGSWPESLQLWLNSESPGPGKVTVVNRSASGRASNHGVKVQTPAALEEKPDAVFIEFSINDAATRLKVTQQEAEDNLNWMIDQFEAQNPNIMIVLQTMNSLPPDTSPFSPREDLNGYYQIYRDVAAERGATLIDHYPNWMDLYTNDLSSWESYMKDVVHPNSTGESTVLIPELKKVLTGGCANQNRSHLDGLYYYKQPEQRASKVLEYELAVYGGTPAGVTASIQAARMGRKVVLVSFNGDVGGMTSGGLTATDIGNRASIGGLANEFYERIGAIKDFSPSKAEALFRTMLEEEGVSLLLNAPLESVDTHESRIVSVRMMTGETISASIFIDATYEGDLIAAAGVSYHVGREPRSTYGESLAGQWQQVSWKGVYQFCDLPISPYVVEGDPNSGLFPEISGEPYGEAGDGDYRVQAYNFRMYLSNREGKIPFPEPQDYDPGRYALLARFLNFDPSPKWTLNYTTRPMTDGPVQMRNGDSNNAGSFSTDYVDGAHRWPDGTYEPVNFSKLPPPKRGLQMPMRELYELREQIFQDHVSYQLGLLYFLANDPQVPDELQARVQKFGLDPNEFRETGHWPHQLYIREGRRMVSDYVMTQADCQSKRMVEDPVGLASYPMDSHFCQRVVVDENGKAVVRNEGGFGHPCPKPYPVAYRSIVPKASECTNLLVPVGLSASHVAFGSIRMEPVFMILGQSAGTAAVMAMEGGNAVQEVGYAKLKKRLLTDGQILELE